ncbi:MAG: hypothetical protein F4201_11185 [Nitrospira sp. SB0677_bin_15]|nr:hypothetical protein [Nitrospira sp. SB0677_bin_15]
MGTPNWNNRTLFHGDNLDFLRAMNDDSVDLIATDPPFNKGRDFHATPDSLAKGGRFQDRWSWEEDVHEEWVSLLKDDNPKVLNVIQGSRNSYGDDMGAFLCFMAVRLLAMRRILKPTGSLYLHCDSTASHYLKELLDSIFGKKQFRNEIVWKRNTSHNSGHQFGRIHDTLLFYSCGKKWTWNNTYTVVYSPQQLSRFRPDGNGRLYKGDDLTAARPNSNSGKFTWRGTTPGPTRGWAYEIDDLERMWVDGRILVKKNGCPRLDGKKVYLDELHGPRTQSIWDDIPKIPNTSSERYGYATQKPLSLYERIILASSNEGDIVLDPFAGCATTLVAAERHKRLWVGIDLWDGAYDAVVQRLQQEKLEDPSGYSQGEIFPSGRLTYSKEPPSRTDGGETATSYLSVPTKQRLALESWQKLSRDEIVQHLAEAQSLTTGLVICAGCGRELEIPFMELDHLTPRSDRGSNDISNRILLCRPCNGKKSDRLTMKGLHNQIKKEGWMKDLQKAGRARDMAQRRCEQVRYGKHLTHNEIS